MENGIGHIKEDFLNITNIFDSERFGRSLQEKLNGRCQEFEVIVKGDESENLKF